MEQQTTEIGLKDKVLRFYLFNKQKVYACSFGFVSVTALLITLLQGREEKKFFHASAAFEQWKKAPADVKLMKEMEQALQKAPRMYRAVEAEIAQTLISEGQTEKGCSIAAGCIKRLAEDCPLHTDFAKATLLIEKMDYQRALESSVTLKERLDLSERGSVLYAWNLLRIAFLQKQLKNQSGELAAWEEVKALFQLEGKTIGKFIEASFGQKNFSLADFISERERSILK